MKNSYLASHQDLVDNRIRSICNHPNFGEPGFTPGDVIARILSPRSKNCSIPKIESFDELTAMVTKWDIIQHGDIAGYLYQELQRISSKKQKGQFFTPNHIVKAMTDDLLACFDIDTIPTVLDPACGSGQFLIHLYTRLHQRMSLETENHLKISEILASEKLFGFDSDPTAIMIARYNLGKISGLPQEAFNLSIRDFLIQDQLYHRPIGIVPGTYDIIIGNPPWGGKLEPDRKKFFKTVYRSALSGINTFTLFMERAFDYSRQGSHISFLVPEAFLNIRAHRYSRELIRNNSHIHRISRWGEQFKQVYAPSISIHYSPSPQPRGSNIVQIMSDRAKNDNLASLVPQAELLTGKDSIYNIHYRKKTLDICSTMDNGEIFSLKGRARFFLGIVTGDNGALISNCRSELHPDPIITGKDISPFEINFSGHYFRYDPRTLQQSAPRSVYQAPEKIVYRFIGKKLTFALDREGRFTLNNVNGFIPDMDNGWKESLVALLNSRLMQYYYEKNFYTVKVLRGNLERLPIINFSGNMRLHLKKLHYEAVNSDRLRKIHILEEIDDIIFREYRLNPRAIENALAAETGSPSLEYAQHPA